MLIEVLCVCRRPPRWVAELTADYARRLPRDLTLEFGFVTPGHDGLASAARKQDEARRLERRVNADSTLVALDERGEQVDSNGLADWLQRWRTEHSRLALVIGGADGLDGALLERARQRWSLSRLTLPHLLVQVIVAEQLYRAWSILDGHPYHRA
ncbi:MAG: 23S rRNA (pseudouridine(1915)-N(3))-methyltransferase RlmH [Gammaproteobacteria bacterium]